MKNSLILSLLAITFALLQSCSSAPTQEASKTTEVAKELQLSAAVSSTFPGFSPKADTVFYIKPSIALDVEANSDITNDSIRFVGTEILGAMQTQKGYQFGALDLASYIVEATIIYGNTYSEADIIREYGVAPDLPDSNTYKKGTLILIIKTLTEKTVWHGAVQIYTDPSLDPEVAKKRTTYAVSSLVSQIP